MLLATDMELIGIYDVGSQVPAPVLPCIALRFGYPIEIVGSQSNWVHTTLCSIDELIQNTIFNLAPVTGDEGFPLCLKSGWACDIFVK